MRSETFPVDGPLELVLSVPAGHVDIETGDEPEATVSVEPVNEGARKALDELRIELAGSRLTVDLGEHSGFRLFARSPAFRVSVRLPHESRLEASTVSADIKAAGRYAHAEIKTVSGGVDLGDVGADASVKSVSGDVRLGRVGGELAVNTVSGDVKVSEAEHGVQIKTISGDQAVGSLTEGRAALSSISGDIRVGIRRGSGVWMDAKTTSGKTHSELDATDGSPDEGPLVELRAKAVSGDIRITRGA